MPAYALIHLSDIHSIKGWYEAQGRVFEELKQDLKTQISCDEEAILIITGDIVQAGDDLESFEEFDQIFSPFLQELGIDQSKRILIPGNHEAQRSYIQNNWPVLDGLACRQETFTDFQNNVRRSYRNHLSPKFENFQLFSSMFTAHPMDDKTFTGYPVNYSAELQFYCLNSAISSFGGLQREDERQLKVDVRSIEQWLQSQVKSESEPIRILLSHHPIEDLHPEHRSALGAIVRRSFDVVMTGHRHDPSGDQVVYELGEHLQLSAPALFASEDVDLGYAIIHIDTDTQEVDVQYRQLSNNKRFVAGSSLADNDSGRILRKLKISRQFGVASAVSPEELRILEARHLSSIQTSPGNEAIWIEPTLADAPEFATEIQSPVRYSLRQIVEIEKDVIVKAPPQFGLSSVAHRLAYIAYRDTDGQKYLVVDASALPNDAKSQLSFLALKCAESAWRVEDLSCVIIDNFSPTLQGAKRKAFELKSAYPEIRVIIMLSVDESDKVGAEFDILPGTLDLYLWTLNRSQVRQIVRHEIGKMQDVREESVLRRVIDDLRDLNLHRTPLNCVALSKIALAQMDRSPVNRTELIEQFLGILFREYHVYAKYSTIPDQKDAQYALAPICKDIILTGKQSFTKEEFFRKTTAYCQKKLIDIELDVLFACLTNANILIQKDGGYQFRFAYWVYYFAAHAMLQEEAFRDWMLDDQHYMKTPQVIEFYTGIDRHRDDIVRKLKTDLDEMVRRFEDRTGFDPDFFVLNGARISPSPQQIERMHKRVEEEVKESDLPVEVKDRFADQDFDRSKPYDQAMRDLIEDSFIGLTRVAIAASTALRNSEHVNGDLKLELFNSIASTWRKMGQVMTLLSFDLAENGYGNFEGYGLRLDDSFSKLDEENRWYSIIAAMPYNIASQTQDFIYSPKLLPLYRKIIRESDDELFCDLLIKHIVFNRPKNWREIVAGYIRSLPKKSIYLYSVFASLREAKKYAILNEEDDENAKQLIKFCGEALKK